MYLKWMQYIYIHGLLGVTLIANLSVMWTFNAIINMCGEELEQLDMARGRIKTV